MTRKSAMVGLLCVLWVPACGGEGGNPGGGASSTGGTATGGSSTGGSSTGGNGSGGISSGGSSTGGSSSGGAAGGSGGEGGIVPASGCLQDLPSAPGSQLSKISALQPGGWVDLGSPAADPRWGKARGRAWTAEMPLAPALGGAFLYGEGVHGFVKPDGHYMDDLWFYDVNAHAWRNCYPGAPAATLQLSISAEGFEVDSSGNPIPVAQQVHGYEMNTYDPDLHAFLSVPSPGSGYWKDAMPQRLSWYEDPPPNSSPWFFEVATGKWNRKLTIENAPAGGVGDLFVYLPSMKKAFFRSSSAGTYLYDATANDWQEIHPSGPEPPFGIDPTACFDPKRNRVYFGGGSYPEVPSGQNALWIYDVSQNAFVDPKPENAPITSFSTNTAMMACDTVNDRVLVIRHAPGSDVGVHVYDPNANTWTAKQSVPSALYDDTYTTMKSGFFDPALNAVFIHEAGDSEDNGTMWAYRYQ